MHPLLSSSGPRGEYAMSNDLIWKEREGGRWKRWWKKGRRRGEKTKKGNRSPDSPKHFYSPLSNFLVTVFAQRQCLSLWIDHTQPLEYSDRPNVLAATVFSVWLILPNFFLPSPWKHPLPKLGLVHPPTAIIGYSYIPCQEMEVGGFAFISKIKVKYIIDLGGGNSLYPGQVFWMLRCRISWSPITSNCNR